MILTLNGVDIGGYINETGFRISRRYESLGTSVKTLDGVVHPPSEKEYTDLVVPMVSLSSDEYDSIISLITKPLSVVSYPDPHYGIRTIQCTTKDNSIDLSIEKPNMSYWDGFRLEFYDCGS